MLTNNNGFSEILEGESANSQKYPSFIYIRVLYIKEHSKPLFNKNKILNLKNLYFYHCANETFKIFKFRSPIAVHDLYKFSTRGQRNIFIITPPPGNTFIYESTVQCYMEQCKKYI